MCVGGGGGGYLTNALLDVRFACYAWRDDVAM